MVLHLCFRLALETQENATLVFEQSVVVKQRGGLSMSETATCIAALLDVLKPHYDEQSSPEEVALE